MKKKKKPKPSKHILFVSKFGGSLDAAYAIKKEGHQVKMFIQDKSCKDIGKGFLRKVRHWEEHVEWADLIVFDYTGFGATASALRAQGKRVIGGTDYTDRLELDRSFGQEELKRHGVKILQYKEFHTFEDAIDFVSQNPDKYVIKPCGEISETKQLLFVGNEDDGKDVIRVLKAYKKTWGNEMGTFQLQKKVQGVEISIAAYFNGKQFLKPINVTFEHKKLFPGELGVSTGEMGTSMFWTDENPIFDASLAKLEKTLAKEGYVGQIDINSIVNGNGIYPLEFTCRFGYPQLQIQRAGIVEPLGEFFYKLAGGSSFHLKTKKGFQVGVLMAVPPFPYDDLKTYESFSKDAVVVFKKPLKEGVHPIDVKLSNQEWLVAAKSGEVLVVTGTGTTMKEAQKHAYNRISNILLPNAYYRRDIGDRWMDDADKLWSWNYL